MVSNATTAGVKKTSKNEPKTAKHSQEKLEKLLDEAQSGEISNGEGPSAGEKVAAAPGPGDESQSMNVDISDAEPEITNESASAGPAEARTRGLNDSTNDKQLLVNFQQWP